MSTIYKGTSWRASLTFAYNSGSAWVNANPSTVTATLMQDGASTTSDVSSGLTNETAAGVYTLVVDTSALSASSVGVVHRVRIVGEGIGPDSAEASKELAFTLVSSF